MSKKTRGRDHLRDKRTQERANGPHAVVSVKASAVERKAVRWLLNGWLPLRMVSLLVGQPGTGKSALWGSIAASTTVGGLDGVLTGVPGDVLVVSYEDAWSETLRPRLEAAEADLDRVHFLKCKTDGYVVDLTHQMAGIERVSKEVDARLLIVDPLVAGMPAGTVNTYRDQDVRSVLSPLAALAERCDLAMLGVMHFSKAAQSALLGAGGSVGFVGAARSVIVFGIDPEDEGGARGPARVMAHAKSNVSRLQRSRRVSVNTSVVDPFADNIETVLAIVGDECDIAADDLVSSFGRPANERGLALKFLRDLLADGPHKAAEAYELADNVGISERTLKRAKRDLGVVSEQRRGGWWWSLPPDDDQMSIEDEETDE